MRGTALAKQGAYKPSAQMRINQQRAAEVCPHSLYTPVGLGNNKEFSPFYGEGK